MCKACIATYLHQLLPQAGKVCHAPLKGQRHITAQLPHCRAQRGGLPLQLRPHLQRLDLFGYDFRSVFRCQVHRAVIGDLHQAYALRIS